MLCMNYFFRYQENILNVKMTNPEDDNYSAQGSLTLIDS